MTSNPTACLLIIGNEVLSGRTRDANLQFLATRLGELGIPMREARVIPDVPEIIIATVNECRARFTHVFTTGGIGPTHDDITSECIARAFGVPWEVHEESRALMAADYARRDPPVEFNAARLRMATLPRGAVPIRCAETNAPGFSMENVHVMAGVPRIMRSMFETLAPGLERGRPVVSHTVHADYVYEGQIAEGLTAIQSRFPELDLGSYPYYRGKGGGVALVAKGTEAAEVEAAAEAMFALLAQYGQAQQGEPAPEG
ncbi:competence/damage-inducible protein A [Belnapia sp. T6]|uniref:Competence/damage-inducible protein A n=1 Tax=Belnapia mucosa TaxID=2804532 RepID=A0ABS1V7N4_9PROT|nr:molybdopterin-binding protein [Belnapia mucosa]MBL6457682.1 competence/damage-inducible protein A [Belnapia mucosa]